MKSFVNLLTIRAAEIYFCNVSSALAGLERVGIAISVGVVLFVLTAMFGLLMERQHNWDKASKTDERRAHHGRPLKHHWSRSKASVTPASGSIQPDDPSPPNVSSCAIRVSGVV